MFMLYYPIVVQLTYCYNNMFMLVLKDWLFVADEVTFTITVIITCLWITTITSAIAVFVLGLE